MSCENHKTFRASAISSNLTSLFKLPLQSNFPVIGYLYSGILLCSRECQTLVGAGIYIMCKCEVFPTWRGKGSGGGGKGREHLAKPASVGKLITKHLQTCSCRCAEGKQPVSFGQHQSTRVEEETARPSVRLRKDVLWDHLWSREEVGERRIGEDGNGSGSLLYNTTDGNMILLPKRVQSVFSRHYITKRGSGGSNKQRRFGEGNRLTRL